MKKKLFSAALALLLLVSAGAPAYAADHTPTFTDVIDSDWYAADVGYVYNEGLMKGSTALLFSPDDAATRGMIVSILYRLEGSPAVSGTMPFSDVALGSYYYDAVKWSALHGIVNGYSTSSFLPNGELTREQFAAILYRYAAYKGADTSARGDLSVFSDAASVNTYAQTAVSWATAAKLLQGTAGGTVLDPGGKATRAQTAAILHRFCTGTLHRASSGNNAFVACPSAAYIFGQMKDDFVFSSGAGAWSTYITVSADGSFRGNYHDANAGESGPGYDASYYYSDFSGRFARPRKLNDYTYAFELSDLRYDGTIGAESYETHDGVIVRKEFTEAYGIAGGTTFYLYLQGAPVKALPESFIDWVSMRNAWETAPDTLPFNGLYNVATDEGFSS
ncbi:MAG: S-layer homology domain-containing protein [Oscillospiraceae bacterium]|jgi:hypothetical protein